ncbi:unnamed protein product [Polarella glacialis]|uniref:Uncharacterized protein n=1 Tax=Polarella glacialis TaxID=89957 RepID=A0A813EGS1_POLGL|nr:unnamed protein product [Polarella glacialis]CAE8735183.1 unnamed protein product [Polarella glacialis]
MELASVNASECFLCSSRGYSGPPVALRVPTRCAGDKLQTTQVVAQTGLDGTSSAGWLRFAALGLSLGGSCALISRALVRRESSTRHSKGRSPALAPGGKRSCALAAMSTDFGLNDFKPRLQTLKQEAKRGDARSQMALGEAYMTGDRVPVNMSEAARWFQLAGEQGVPEAQFNLGQMLFSGEAGLQANKEQAFYWLAQAAEKKVAAARYYVGMMYLDGDGVDKDLGIAINYLTAALDQGVSEANYPLGTAYLACAEKGDTLREEWAAFYLKSAATAESAEAQAQHDFGRLLLEGKGLEQDPAQGAEMISAAANQGYEPAQYLMGTLLLDGTGVDQNKAWAAYWFEEARVHYFPIVNSTKNHRNSTHK